MNRIVAMCGLRRREVPAAGGAACDLTDAAAARAKAIEQAAICVARGMAA
jgi:hypothetical protein